MTPRMLFIWTFVLAIFSALFHCVFVHYSLLDNAILQDNLWRPRVVQEDEHSVSKFRCSNTSAILPEVPSFIIVGTHKGGTTALYNILGEHPNLLASDQAEPHFFDSIDFLNVSGLAENQQVLCKVREMYASLFPQSRLVEPANDTQPLITFEKTPVYMMLPHLPKLVSVVCPWTRLVVSLRDPVSRLQSGHSGREAIETAIESNMKDLREMGLTTAPLLSNYIKAPARYMDEDFDLPKNLTHEGRNQLWKGCTSNGLYRGFYAQQLRNWLEYFPLESKIKVIDFELFRKDKKLVLNEILNFVGAPIAEMSLNSRTLDADHSPGRPRAKNMTMNELTFEYLKKFYRPYNEELYDLLGESWRGRWD